MDVVEGYGEDFNPDDLFYGEIRELQYAQGAVAAISAHCTLLFGIHPYPTEDEYREAVSKALAFWSIGEIPIGDVKVFPSRIEGQDYNCLVLEVLPTSTLLIGRRLIEDLPHTDTYPEYRPHVTLVYLKGSADLEEWKRRMQAAFSNQVVKVIGLDLGID